MAQNGTYAVQNTLPSSGIDYEKYILHLLAELSPPADTFNDFLSRATADLYRGKVPPPLSQALYIAWFVEFLTNHRRTLAPQERDAFDDAGRRMVHRRVARLTSSQLMLPSAVAPSPLVQQGSYVHLTGTNVLLPPLPNGVSQEQGQLTRKVQDLPAVPTINLTAPAPVPPAVPVQTVSPVESVNQGRNAGRIAFWQRNGVFEIRSTTNSEKYVWGSVNDFRQTDFPADCGLPYDTRVEFRLEPVSTGDPADEKYHAVDVTGANSVPLRGTPYAELVKRGKIVSYSTNVGPAHFKGKGSIKARDGEREFLSFWSNAVLVCGENERVRLDKLGEGVQLRIGTEVTYIVGKTGRLGAGMLSACDVYVPESALARSA